MKIQQPVPLAIPTHISQHSKLEARAGDLTEQTDVEAIVNAANIGLQLGSGVAGAIRQKDRSGAIQKACDQLIKKYGPVPTGGAALTSAGDLAIGKLHAVIHAVGPIYSPEVREECRMQLFQAYWSALQLAAAHEIRSIAFPLLSTGVYGFPIEAGAAQLPLLACSAYLTENPEAFDRIRFVGFESSEAFQELQKLLAKA